MASASHLNEKTTKFIELFDKPNIISTGSSLTMFKFFDLGTKAFELEAGNTVNEPVNYAVRVAIEQAVVELIKQGEEQSLWKYKD